MSQKPPLDPETQDIIADALLASPLGPGIGRGIRRADGAVRARRLTPAEGEESAARVAAAASKLLAGRGPEASS